MSTTVENIQMDSKQLESIKNLIDSRIDNKLKEIEENHTPSMALIATKGTLDWAYPPFILGSTAAALGWDVKIFFTFYGLLLLKKDLSLEVSGLGNPAMPMKMPFGPQWFQNIEWPMPNLIMASIPGFEKVATGLMKMTFSNKGVATIEELRSLSLEAEDAIVGGFSQWYVGAGALSMFYLSLRAASNRQESPPATANLLFATQVLVR